MVCKVAAMARRARTPSCAATGVKRQWPAKRACGSRRESAFASRAPAGVDGARLARPSTAPELPAGERRLIALDVPRSRWEDVPLFRRRRMRHRVKSIGVFSLAKMMGFLYGLLGLLVAPIFLLLGAV